MARTFSEKLKCFMARDRKDFIIRARGNSQEICHNLIRLILRPNSESANHWKTELSGLISKSICGEYKVKRLPTYYYLSDITKINEREISYNALESLVEEVKLEPYGTYRDLSLNLIKDKLEEFIQCIPDKGVGISLSELKNLINNYKY